LLFQNKWQKLWVTTAGIYVEAFMCSVATAVWVASYPDTLINELAYKTMLFTGISTVFFNINPLIKIDGYYALASILEIPELREESLRYIGAVFQKYVLRLPVEVPVVSRRKRRIYWIYGTLALAWVGTIMAFIAGLLNNFYTKYFGDFAIVLLLLTLYRFFRKRVRLVTRTGRALYLDKKELLMSPRSRLPLLAAAATLFLVLFIPWTRRMVRTEAVLKPETQVRLEAPEDAIVLDVLAGEGEALRAGQPVFRLGSPASRAEQEGLAARHELAEKQASGARESGTPQEVFGSESRRSSLEVAISGDRARRERLIVRSPIAGRLLTSRLEDLRGRFVPVGFLLAEVGGCRRMTAELPVSERLLNDLERGAAVSVMLRSDPFSTLRGKVVSISPATLAQPTTAAEKREPAGPSDYPDQFVALTIFENPEEKLLPGMIGRAKIYAKRASFAARAWRVLSRWVQTIVW
jgi:putative peptide zinc metalloprotease protein